MILQALPLRWRLISGQELPWKLFDHSEPDSILKGLGVWPVKTGVLRTQLRLNLFAQGLVILLRESRLFLGPTVRICFRLCCLLKHLGPAVFLNFSFLRSSW